MGGLLDKDINNFKNKQKKSPKFFGNLFGDPRGARTHDPNIKSVVLYQLS